jgi:hydrophobic/amphiphilic exporter-1 (mainly G- bacteria), HAE1 family
MNLPKLSIERPAFISSVIAMILLLGVMSYRELGVDQFPDVNFPYVTVMTTYVGAGPEEIETLVSKPLEDEFSTVEGLKKITSVSQDSFSMLICEFTLETPMKDAEQRIRDRMPLARPKMPKEIEEPIVRRFDPADMPVAILSFEANLPPTKAYDIAKEVAKPRLSRVPGIGVVDVYGGAQREIRVELDRNKLNDFRISAGQVAARISANNQNVPVGKVEKGKMNLVFRTVGEYRDLDRIKKTVVSFWGSDVAVTVDKLGEVKDTTKEADFKGYLNGNPAIYLIVFKQSKANTVAAADTLNEEIKKLNQEYEKSATPFKITNVYDTSHGIRISLKDVKITILEGIVLTILVIILFLGSMRTTIITISALPVSIAGAFILMNAMGFTLNVMTLLALSMTVGLLVDDAIVVRENIWRHIEAGEDPKNAAINGTLEVAMAVVATTSVILAVFGPIGFLTGMVGQFFRQLGFTVCFAMGVSLFEAMTMGPMLSAYWAPKHFHHDKLQSGFFGRIIWIFEQFQLKLTRWYELAIRWILEKNTRVMKFEIPNRLMVILYATLIFASSFATIPFIRFTFMPQFDSGEFQLTLKAKPGTSIATMSEHVLMVDKILRSYPETERVTSMAGDPGTYETYKGQFFIKLVDQNRRKRSTDQVKEALRKDLEPYREALQPQVAEINPVGGDEAPFNVILRGDDYHTLIPLAEDIKKKFAAIPGLADMSMNYDGGMPEFQVRMDPVRMTKYGVSGVEAGVELRTQVEGVVPAKLREAGMEYDIRVRVKENQRDLEQSYQSIRVPNQNNQLVRLSDVAEGVHEEGPSKINRRDRSRYIMVSGQLAPKGSLGNIIIEAQKIMKGTTLPPSVTYEFVGQAEELKSLIHSVLIAVGLSILFAFLVLTSLYESPVIPIAILLAVPLAWIGAFLALAITGQALNIFSMIALVMLNGLVTKNSILLVDYTLQGQKRGLSRNEAIVEAGKIRLRPILMTTVALIAGMLPLAMALTDAGKFRQSMGVAVIGGLITSLFMTLLVVPATFGYVDNIRLWFRKVFKSDEIAARAEGKNE